MYQIPNTPLPSFKKLLKAFLSNSTINHNDLSKHWATENGLELWLSRSSYSMRLLARFRLQESKKDSINMMVTGNKKKFVVDFR